MKVVVGIGSNVGDRLATMREAVRRIDAHAHARVEAVSRVYETEPVGGPEQGRFLNAAIAVAWEGEPIALLEVLQSIEHELGRRRDAEVRWGPRTLDLDILWIEGGAVIDEPRLVVPHPRLAERAFALVPLLEIAPEAGYELGGAGGAVRATDASLTGP